MLTQCDRCAAVFRVNPAQLRQAQGFVRCGACQQVFYAVDRLLDESPAKTEAAEPAAPQQQTDLASTAIGVAPTSAATASEQPATATARAPVSATQVPVPVADQEELPPLRRDTADLEQDSADPELPIARSVAMAHSEPVAEVEGEEEREAVPDTTGPRISLAELDAGAAAEDEYEYEYREATEAPGVVGDDDVEPEQEPDVLQQDLAALRGQPETRAGWRRLWATLAMLLMLVFAAQLTWFFREPLLARFPTWRAPVERWCTALGCQLGGNDPASNIELQARDVRDHPRFAEALLANLTMVSGASTVQRYPRIELSLFDATGQVLGKRRFAPEEYLDPSIDVAAGMQPSRPVFVVLELAGPYTNAVGFEFDFP